MPPQATASLSDDATKTFDLLSRPREVSAARSLAALLHLSPSLIAPWIEHARRVPLPIDASVESIPKNSTFAENINRTRNANDKHSRSAGVGTFVMLPLDFTLDSTWLVGDTLEYALTALSRARVRGVMLDVWWGLCEREPQRYNFEKYVALADACRRHGLQVQVVMAFHSCGGNVGDNVNVYLPKWVEDAADANDAWFLDRNREGVPNREYISIGADHVPFLPGSTRRTPVQAYADFVEAFCDQMQAGGFLGRTVSEIQIGVGPCGELRYPSYQLRGNKWRFPGIGEFQCFDHRLLDSLAQAASHAGHLQDWASPPVGTGNYNSRPSDAPFFRTEYASKRGRFFLRWYSNALVQHCEDVLSAVRASNNFNGASLAVKISGIHWHYLSPSRAAEATAGYLVSESYCFYNEVVQVLAKHNAVLDFTCLEMASKKQLMDANSAPQQLVHDVFEVAARSGVTVSGENALPCCDRESFIRVVDAFRWSRARAHSFTLLRLERWLLEHHNLEQVRLLADNLRSL